MRGPNARAHFQSSPSGVSRGAAHVRRVAIRMPHATSHVCVRRWARR